MAEGKKDVLEFPLEEVSVPQAIALMMQAASKTGNLIKAMQGDDCFDAHIDIDNERLQQLVEKLEARVEDELEKGVTPVLLESENDPDVPIAEADIFLMEDGQILNHKGVIFQKACNRAVYFNDERGNTTTCIKRFNHTSPVHEDEFGNEAAAR